MSATEEIRQSIQSRLRAIEAEMTSLKDALKRLDADGVAAASRTNGRQNTRPRASDRPRRPHSRSRRTTAPVASVTLEQLLLSTSGGVSASQLAEQLGADRSHVLAQLKALEARGDVRRTGERRATRWYAVTDEDRIRERAAELERRSRRRPAAAGWRS